MVSLKYFAGNPQSATFFLHTSVKTALMKKVSRKSLTTHPRGKKVADKDLEHDERKTIIHNAPFYLVAAPLLQQKISMLAS